MSDKNGVFKQDIAPDFDKGGGLLPVIAQDAASGEVLMLAYMNQEAYDKTLATGEVHYWSRSRKSLWRKGTSSGHLQRLISLRLDCDSDAILVRVKQIGGAACHTGRQSCFFREYAKDGWRECSPLIFDPKEVYK
ncbi:phosphoribosyl-AMP cyclohydrolase [Desulfovibrio sp. OttesenSCG-928-G11]|nr:phosphoribosyl-AMP cyclohydrolase [Desulfovibrio sp. OttesenSCG-928-G11]